jgi:hypothetical protein
MESSCKPGLWRATRLLLLHVVLAPFVIFIGGFVVWREIAGLIKELIQHKARVIKDRIGESVNGYFAVNAKK